MRLRLVHRNGEVRSLEVGKGGNSFYVHWPIAGWYRVYGTGRVAGAKSWKVHPDDLGLITPPPRPKRQRKRRTTVAG